MDPLVLIATTVNFVALGLLVAAMLAYSLNSWTHSMRSFVAMIPLTFFAIEIWSAVTSPAGSFLRTCMNLLLTVSITATIKFGFDALIKPRLTRRPKRIASSTKVKPLDTSRVSLDLTK